MSGWDGATESDPESNAMNNEGGYLFTERDAMGVEDMTYPFTREWSN